MPFFKKWHHYSLFVQVRAPSHMATCTKTPEELDDDIEAHASPHMATLMKTPEDAWIHVRNDANMGEIKDHMVETPETPLVGVTPKNPTPNTPNSTPPQTTPPQPDTTQAISSDSNSSSSSESPPQVDVTVGMLR